MVLSWDQAAEREFWADTCRKSCWWFAREAYNIEGNPKGGWFTERIHKPLCDWFQGHIDPWMAARRNKRGYELNLIILIPREFGKTTLFTNAALLWLMTRDPEMSIYIGSENVDKAVKFLEPIKQTMNGADPYQHFTAFFGSWYDKNRTWSQQTVVHGKRTTLSVQDPSFGVWGVQTGLTGAHPDVICLDDPISYEKMEQDSDWLQTVNDHIASLIPVLKGDGLRIFIGTRYHDGDHFGKTFKKHGIKTLSGAPELMQDFAANEEGLWNVYFLSGRNLNREPVFPEQWPEERLKAFEKENSLRYYAQIENNPVDGEHVALTRQDVDRCWVEKRDVPRNLRISFHIDTAFKVRARQARDDESVIQVWGHARDGSGDVYYLEGYSSASWTAKLFNDKLVSLLQKYRRNGQWPFILTDEIESFGKSGTWELTLQSWCHEVDIPCPNLAFMTRSFKNRKEARIIAAASYWRDGKVHFAKDAPGIERLIDQMLKIGVSDHDDWSDPAADVFSEAVYKPRRLDSKPKDDYVGDPDDQPAELRLRYILNQHRRETRRERQGGYEPID